MVMKVRNNYGNIYVIQASTVLYLVVWHLIEKMVKKHWNASVKVWNHYCLNAKWIRMIVPVYQVRMMFYTYIHTYIYLIQAALPINTHVQ